MNPKIYEGSILESNERLIGIGLNASGELDLPFLKEVALQHPPVIKLFRRWIEKDSITPGDFQGVPGLLTPDGAMIRPTFYNLVTASDDGAYSRTGWITKSIQDAWDETNIFGFESFALHAPSIMRGEDSPAERLLNIINKMGFRYPDRFRIYSL